VPNKALTDTLDTLVCNLSSGVLLRGSLLLSLCDLGLAMMVFDFVESCGKGMEQTGVNS
jgi:hypothetical protein